VDEVLLYEAVPEPADPAAVSAALDADYLTFTASSTVRAFTGLLSDAHRARLAAGGPRVVSIGPVTSATAREQGLRVDAEAAQHSIPGLVAALLGDASS
jgi:uroporphyrinogen III methyltransferase/synthase